MGHHDDDIIDSLSSFEALSIFPLSLSGLPADHLSLGAGQARQHSRGAKEGLGNVGLFVGGTKYEHAEVSVI